MAFKGEEWEMQMFKVLRIARLSLLPAEIDPGAGGIILWVVKLGTDAVARGSVLAALE